MNKARTIKIISTLAVVFSFCIVLFFTLIQPSSAGKPVRLEVSPIWQITQEGTPVNWVDADNPRFCIYDPGTPGDETDDLVLDKETGLVWERSPYPDTRTWVVARESCYRRQVANRRGWRLPTVEELASLVDNDNSNPALPTGHPFYNVHSTTEDYYWSSSTFTEAPAFAAWTVSFWHGSPDDSGKGNLNYWWCVRGGHGHDAY